MECVASGLPLFHARWTAPEVRDEYIEEEFWEGKKLNLSKSLFNHSRKCKRNIAVIVKRLRCLYLGLSMPCMSGWHFLFGIFNRPNQLTQCCTQLKSTRVQFCWVLYLHYNIMTFTFK